MVSFDSPLLSLVLFTCLFASYQAALIADCDVASQWSGRISISTSIKIQGTGSLLWNHSLTSNVVLAGVNTTNMLDLTSGNANTFSFWCYLAAPKPNGKILLQMSSENPDTVGIDYYSYEFSLNFMGWKMFSSLFSAFSSGRTPLGWNKITGVSFNGAGWDITPDPSIVIYVDNVTTSYSSPFCAMDDNDFFSSLNYNGFPGLSAVKANFQANNMNGARSAMATYLRTRTNVKYSFDPRYPNKSLVSPPSTTANQAVQGTYIEVNKPYTFKSGLTIDWTLNPTINNPQFPYDAEWQWQLNRMAWWTDLGRAWWYTANSSYAETFAAQVQSFYTSQPRPCSSVNSGHPSTWRTIECGIRTSSSFADGFMRFLTAPQMTDDVIVNFMKLFGDHGRHLLQWNTGGNWLTMEMNGLYTLAGLFPEFSDSYNWRIYAAQRLYNDMAVQLLADGAHYELSTGYHQVYLDNSVGIYTAAKMYGTLNELPSDYLKALQKAYEYNVKIMQPNWMLPLLNDAWAYDMKSTCQSALQYFPSSTLLQFGAKQQGAPLPSFTSIYLADSGRAVMRTGWNSYDTFALLDVGPLGHAHQHQDKLSLVFSSYGRPLLWDGGGGQYEDSKWRNYAISTYNHNTAVIDDLPQNRDTSVNGGMGSGNPNTPAPVWQTTNNYDYAQGTYMDGYGTFTNTIATHHREVFFLKSFNTPAFIVVDRFIPNNTLPHKYTVIWNFETTNTTLENKYKMFYSQDPKVGNVAILPLASVSSTTVTQHVAEDGNMLWGWDVTRAIPYYVPATTVLHERTGAGVQYLVTLMLSLPPSSPFSSANLTAVTSTMQSYSIAINNAPQIKVDLNTDANVGGMKVTVGGTTYTSPNYGSTTPYVTTAATSSSTSSPSTSSGVSGGGTSSTPSPSSGTTGEHKSAACLLHPSLLSSFLLLVVVSLL